MSEDFGLAYESIFDGSMYGTGPTVFAVWLYVIAKGYGGTVTLNPRKLAETLGATREDVEAAIAFHCSPDRDSRTDTDEGRRLRHLGGYSYEVVNHELYKSARALEEKRAYNRLKKRASRERSSSTIEVPVFDTSKKLVTSGDPLLSSSSSSDLISSDPEGVQGEPPEPESEPSRFAPADFAPTEAQRQRCRELGHDAEKLLRKFKRQEFNRTYTDWERRFDQWIDEEPESKRPSARPPSLGPPWVDDSHRAFAREHALELAREARLFADTHHPPPRLLQLSDARVAFGRFLEERVRDTAAA